jgi:hypothetical protein
VTDDLDEWCRSNWDKVPEEKRKLCLDHLKKKIDAATLRRWKECGFPPGFHMFAGGMAVRNTLRDVMVDEELPAVSWNNGEAYSNWDDYYTGALQELLETTA